MLNHKAQFAWANIAYLCSGKLRTKNGNTPLKNHRIPQDFACIGVATSENPASDDYIIAQLKTLNIQRVRLDFTYGDPDSHVARFLESLLANAFKVHLHLVQPFEAAQQMSKASAQKTWQHFVQGICERYGARVALIEIGSTINRKRWAGYTLQSFLTMWDIAYQEVKSHNILLAGPSVTDFEPLYNIGVLSLLKKRNKLPDIHTDNLFSERCTEPERDDHKILGHTLARFAGFRLVKKAWVLRNIGAKFGVTRLHSPSAFWTLPRIARLLPDTLEKQADYLSRYMILCAASGALESAAWGPLICHREGLVDDQINKYPTLERITHYQSIGQDASSYTIRPAFYAYQTFIKFISGLQYLHQLKTGDGLEVHVFSNDQKQMHAVWTTNAKAAALCDIYFEDDLKTASFFNRDGLKIEIPSLATESPTYIQFNKKIEMKTNTNIEPLNALFIHAHMQSKTFHLYRQDDWRGIITANNVQMFELLAQALNPQLMQGPTNPTILRKARNAIWTIPDPRDANKKLVVKQPVKVPWFKKITDHYKPSKALRSWNGANELLRRGVDNAAPIAYFEKKQDHTRKLNYYICEYVPADFSLRDMFTAFANGATAFEGVTQQSAYQQVSDYLFNMHSHGVFFRDLSGGNVLIKKINTTELTFSLIDTGRAHFFNHGTVLSKRLSDMSRACNKLHPAGRNTLMTMYMQKMGRSFGFWQRLPFIIYNAKVIIKRKLKRKNLMKLFGMNKKTSN
jgi:hypothetical protein